VTTFIDTSVFCALPATDEDEHDAARAEFITVERLTHDILPAIDVEMAGADRQAPEDLVRDRSRSVSFVDRVSFAFMRERASGSHWPSTTTSRPRASRSCRGPRDVDRVRQRTEAISENPWLRSGFVALVVSVTVMLATVFRQTGVPKWSTIWAEDGTVFAQCAYDRSTIACLTEAYAGYAQLVPRLAAELATLGGPEGLPSRLMLLAGLVAAGAGAVAAIAVYRVTGSLWAGILSGVGLALVNPAGIEVLGNLANLHWILLSASVVIIVCMWLGNPPGWTGNTVLVLTTLSSPLGPVLLVPMGLVAVAKRSPGARSTTMAVTCAAVLQSLAMVNSERPAPSGPSPTLADLVSWTGVAVRDWGWFGPEIPNSNLLMAGGMVAVLGLLVMRRQYWVAIIVASLTAVGLAVLASSASLNHAVIPRHAYVLITLMLCGFAIGLGNLAGELRRPVRSLVMVLIVAIAGLGFATSFKVESGSSGGPDVMAQVDAADCSTGTSISIEIAPRGWRMSIPCPGS